MQVSKKEKKKNIKGRVSLPPEKGTQKPEELAADAFTGRMRPRKPLKVKKIGLTPAEKHAKDTKEQLASGVGFTNFIQTHIDCKLQELSKECAERNNKREAATRWKNTLFRVEEASNEMKDHLNKYSPKLEECITLLKELSALKVDRLTLLLSPGALNVIKNITEYNEKPNEWTSSQEQEQVYFEKIAKKIRTKSAKLYKQFQDHFVVPKDFTFLHAYSLEVAAFQKTIDGSSADFNEQNKHYNEVIQLAEMAALLHMKPAGMEEVNDSED